MALDIVFLVDGSEASLLRFAEVKRQYPFAKKCVCVEQNIFKGRQAAAKVANTKMFYLIQHNVTLSDTFDFDFTPEKHDEGYIHYWAAGRITIISKRNAGATDTPVKYMTDQSDIILNQCDVVFISYDEPNAEENWAHLCSRVPNAKRIHGTKGIFNAHAEAAAMCETEHFFVVDGDTQLLDSFDFPGVITRYDADKYVHIWKCRNNSNGLEYGYGGLKLVNKAMFGRTRHSYVDMTTLLGDGVKVMDAVASKTIFNSDAFRAFRGAFRECAKLSSHVINNSDASLTSERLASWCAMAAGPFSVYVITGADLGRIYGAENVGDQTALQRINDFEWMKLIYDNACDELIGYPD